MNIRFLGAGAAACLIALPLPAQSLSPVFLMDSTEDAIYRLADLDANGNFNDANEIAPFYVDTVGPLGFTNNVGGDIGPNGALYVCDNSPDYVVALIDLNADGDAHDLNEATVFFDSATNASGVVMTSAQDLDWDGNVLWIVDAGVTGNDDSIIRLEDLNANGNANDMNEARKFYVPAPGGMGGDSVPQDVEVGPDGAVYYLEASSTGALAFGIWRLVDTDMSGFIDQPGEAAVYYSPTTSALGFPTSLIFATDGACYLTDSSLDQVRRLVDGNNDKVITEGSEDSVWFTSPGASILWEIAQAADGAFYLAESESPDRLLRLVDSDMSGAIDPMTELTTIYDDTMATIDVGNPRGIAIGTPTSPFRDLCSGDGGVAPGCTGCPCGNDAVVGTVGGCLNTDLRSARLLPAGFPSVGADSLRFELSGGTTLSFAILVSGAAAAPTNPANPCFGLESGVTSSVLDGLRCAVNDVRRHGSRSIDANGDVGTGVPGPGNAGWGPPDGPGGGLIAQGGFAAGQTRYYQAFYRTVDTLGCLTGQNTSQAVEVPIVP